MEVWTRYYPSFGVEVWPPDESEGKSSVSSLKDGDVVPIGTVDGTVFLSILFLPKIHINTFNLNTVTQISLTCMYHTNTCVLMTRNG